MNVSVQSDTGTFSAPVYDRKIDDDRRLIFRPKSVIYKSPQGKLAIAYDLQKGNYIYAESTSIEGAPIRDLYEVLVNHPELRVCPCSPLFSVDFVSGMGLLGHDAAGSATNEDRRRRMQEYSIEWWLGIRFSEQRM